MAQENPPSDWTARVAIAAAVLAVVVLLVLAGVAGVTGGSDDVDNPAVEALLPPPGSQQPRQSPVGVDLVAGWTAELEIAGRSIPLDQLDSFDPDLGRPDDPLGRIVFHPGPGKEFADLPQDRVCVVATLTQLDGDGTGVERWCFDAV